jgi:hypothetical protein
MDNLNKSNSKLVVAIKWARIAALLSIALLGLELAQIVFGGITNSSSVIGLVIKFVFTSIFTLITAINLFNFGKYAKVSLQKDNEKFLYQSFRHLRIYFTVLGISIIIVASIGLLIGILYILSKIL